MELSENRFFSKLAFKPNPKNWPFALWFACASLVISFLLCIGNDELLSRREYVWMGLSFLLSFVLGIIIFRHAFHLRLQPVLLAVSALAAGFALRCVFSGTIVHPLSLPSQIELRVDGLDRETQLQLEWAYWAEVPQPVTGDISQWTHVTDISLAAFGRSGDWQNAENGFLVTKTVGSKLTYKAPLHIHTPVLCLVSSGGSSQVSISGEESPITIQAGQTKCLAYPQTQVHATLDLILSSILLGGLAAFLLALCFYIWHPLRSIKGKWQSVCIYTASFLLPCAVVLAICAIIKITPFGEKTFLINDMFSEYADYMAYFRSILHGDNNLLYSFSKSIGDDFISLLAFYVINPINWIVCLFPPEKLPLLLTPLVIVRFGVCGLTCAVYLKKSRGMNWSALLFSLCYALMAFNFANAENTNLREGAMLLPLVILGIDRLLEGRSPRVYIVSLVCTIFLNYYSAYQICIFGFLYFVYRLLLPARSEGLRVQGRLIWRFVLASILSISIGAALLLPVAFQISGGQKTFELSKLDLSFTMGFLELAGKLFNGAYDYGQINSSGLPSLFCGTLVSLGLGLFFLNRAIGRRERYLTAAFLLLMQAFLLVNGLNLAIHGFNAPEWWPYRDAFIICFFLILIAARCYEKPEGLLYTETVLCAGAAILLAICLAHKEFSWLSSSSILLSLVLCGTFCLLLPLTDPRRGQREGTLYLISILCLLDLFLNGYVILSENMAYQRSETVTNYQKFYAQNNPVIQSVKERDGSFYRIEKTYSRNANDAMLLNYNGLAHYSSTLKQSVMKFLPEAGFRYYPFRFLYWEGSTVAMDSLLGIKYLLSTPSTINKPYSLVFEQNELAVYQNPYALPLAFMAEKDAVSEDVSQVPATFELQNHILSSLSGEKADVFVSAQVNEPTLQNLKKNDTGNSNLWRRIDPDQEAWLEWDVKVEKEGVLYAFFPSDTFDLVDISVDDQLLSPYFDNYSSHVLKLGNFTKGQHIRVRMTLRDGEVCFSDAQFFSENAAQLETDFQALSDEGAELKKISSSHLKGSITANQDGLLFFSIPFDQGWNVKLDGKKLQTLCVFDTFLGGEISAGTHRIEMQFIPRGLKAGLLISLISMICAGIWSQKKHFS